MERIGIYTIFTGKFVDNFTQFALSFMQYVKSQSTNEYHLHIITDNARFFETQTLVDETVQLYIHHTDNLTDKIINICKYNLYLKYLQDEDYILICDSNVNCPSTLLLQHNTLYMSKDYPEKFCAGDLNTIKQFLASVVNSVNWDLVSRRVYSDLTYITNYIKSHSQSITFIENVTTFKRIPRLGIYYLATGKYNDAFEGFMKHIASFYPQFSKTIILMSDKLSQYDGQTINNCKIEYHQVCGYPWPIVTLYKMKYMLDYKGDYDYCCYCNADVVFNKDFTQYQNIDLTKLSASKHNWMDDNFVALALKDDNPESTSYIGNHVYDYANGCFFMGNARIFYRMCEDVVNMMEIDLQHNIIPKWHDETYLNKWCYTHQDIAQTNIRLIFPCEPHDEGPCYLDYDAVKKPKVGE